MSSEANGVFVVGVDPGPVNMGVCLYDAATRRAVDAELIALRTPLERGVSSSDIIARLSAMMSDRSSELWRRFFSRADGGVFVENQSDASSVSQLAIQHCLQALLGVGVCRVVSPSAVKARYPEAFPRIGSAHRASVKHPAAAQRRANKKNAKAFARTFFPSDVYARVSKRADAFDAFWVARYGAETML